jgi:hypothetical protein
MIVIAGKKISVVTNYYSETTPAQVVQIFLAFGFYCGWSTVSCPMAG